MFEIENKIEWIGDLFQSVEPIYLWCFDWDGRVVATNNPEIEFIDQLFDIHSWRQYMLRHFQLKDSPYIMGSPFGIVWMCAVDKYFADSEQKRIYVLGPVSTSTISQQQLQAGLESSQQKYKGKGRFDELVKAFDHAPVISPNMIQRYTTMLHYVLNSEKITLDMIEIRRDSDDTIQKNWQKTKDRHKNYRAEQALLHAIRTGDRNYMQALRAAQSVGNGIVITSSDPLRSLKNTMIIITTLCTRAAIEGGLSPEEAYSLGDRYIQEAENSRNAPELTACCHNMYFDFIARVHQKRANPLLSPHIQNCCDYIDLHCEEKLRIKDLAEYVGYSEYYLSKCFKQETGITINDYIRFSKIERAKIILLTTDLGIGEIAETLCFSSRGYFSEVFSQVVGTTPSVFRKKNQQH